LSRSWGNPSTDPPAETCPMVLPAPAYSATVKFAAFGSPPDFTRRMQRMTGFAKSCRLGCLSDDTEAPAIAAGLQSFGGTIGCRYFRIASWFRPRITVTFAGPTDRPAQPGTAPSGRVPWRQLPRTRRGRRRRRRKTRGHSTARPLRRRGRPYGAAPSRRGGKCPEGHRRAPTAVVAVPCASWCHGFGRRQADGQAAFFAIANFAATVGTAQFGEAARTEFPRLLEGFLRARTLRRVRNRKPAKYP
jgi:hypothetical protein